MATAADKPTIGNNIRRNKCALKIQLMSFGFSHRFNNSHLHFRSAPLTCSMAWARLNVPWLCMCVRTYACIVARYSGHKEKKATSQWLLSLLCPLYGGSSYAMGIRSLQSCVRSMLFAFCSHWVYILANKSTSRHILIAIALLHRAFIFFPSLLHLGVTPPSCHLLVWCVLLLAMLLIGAVSLSLSTMLSPRCVYVFTRACVCVWEWDFCYYSISFQSKFSFGK